VVAHRDAATGARAARASRPNGVQVAIEHRTGHTCSWWSPTRKRFVTRGCRRPLFVAVKASRGRWRLMTGRLGTGSVTVWVRGVTAAGTQEQVFRLGRNKRTLRITRPRHRRA
jgi:hypothetical protein